LSATHSTKNGESEEVREVFLGPGDLEFSETPAVLKTILGSCVAVCLHDTKLHHGGMCHFILPDVSSATAGRLSPQAFGEDAVQELLERMLATGSDPRSVTAKVLGGSHLSSAIEAEIGARNIAVARRVLGARRISITGESVGGSVGRRVRFETASGRTQFRLVEGATEVTPARPSRKTLILIGASTGGTEALARVLTGMRKPLPPVVIVQHIPPGFTRNLAANLQRHTDLHVSEALDRERIEDNHVYIAPGGKHLVLVEQEGSIVMRLTNDDPVHSCRPSVDVTFFSAAQISSRRFVAAILTGMGSDGAESMRTLHDRGAYTLAQDEESCVVFGMPKAAIEAGAVDRVVALEEFGFVLSHAANSR